VAAVETIVRMTGVAEPFIGAEQPPDSVDSPKCDVAEADLQ
jgi:hypothetical protein